MAWPLSFNIYLFMRLFPILGLSAIVIALLSSYLLPASLPPWRTFYNQLAFVLFLGTLSTIYLAKNKLSLANPLPWAMIALCVCLHILIISHLSPAIITASAFFLLFFGICYASYSLGLSSQTGPYLSIILFTLLLASLISSALAIVQWSGIAEHMPSVAGLILQADEGSRVFSNIGQSNNLGTLLITGLAITGYFWKTNQNSNRVADYLLGASAFLLIFGIYLSGSRTAALNLLAWPVLFYLWSKWNNQKFPLITIAPAALLYSFYAVMPILIDWMQWFPAAEARSLISDQARLRIWGMVLEGIASSPWFGQGFEAVPSTHLTLSPTYGDFGQVIARHAHNTPLDMFIIFGLPFGLVITLGVVYLWAKSWTQSTLPEQHFLWLITTAILVHSLLELPLHYGFFLWLLFFVLGYLSGTAWKTIATNSPVKLSAAWLTALALMIMPVWLGYVQVEKIYTLYRQQGSDITHHYLSQNHFILSKSLYAEPYERLHWATLPLLQAMRLTPSDLQKIERQAHYYPLPTLSWRIVIAHASLGNISQAEWWGERLCAMFDVRICIMASEEWSRLMEQNSQMPSLPWDHWISKKAK